MNGDRIRLDLTREETGTLLGTIAWVMGALQIMRDRGHAESNEEFHDLHDLLVPRLESLLERITQARQSGASTPQRDAGLEADLEAAYTAIRSAFETWIELTAVDTLSAAVAERLGGQGSQGDAAPDDAPEGPATP